MKFQPLSEYKTNRPVEMGLQRNAVTGNRGRDPVASINKEEMESTRSFTFLFASTYLVQFLLLFLLFKINLEESDFHQYWVSSQIFIMVIGIYLMSLIITKRSDVHPIRKGFLIEKLQTLGIVTFIFLLLFIFIPKDMKEFALNAIFVIILGYSLLLSVFILSFKFHKKKKD